MLHVFWKVIGIFSLLCKRFKRLFEMFPTGVAMLLNSLTRYALVQGARKIKTLSFCS